jgi:hypothetical protein
MVRRPDAELAYAIGHREMLDLHFSGVPVRDALARVPVVPVEQDPPFEAHSGPTRHGTREAHVVVPRDTRKIVHPLAALADVSLVIDELDRLRAHLVAECRRRGRSWSDIAAALGVARQSAWERYSSPDD